MKERYEWPKEENLGGRDDDLDRFCQSSMDSWTPRDLTWAYHAEKRYRALKAAG